MNQVNHMLYKQKFASIFGKIFDRIRTHRIFFSEAEKHRKPNIIEGEDPQLISETLEESPKLLSNHYIEHGF